MVRLLRSSVAWVAGAGVYFNPTMVRLLPPVPNAGWNLAKDFNPTMVRLLPYFIRFVATNLGRFQSHNGAIAAQVTEVDFSPTVRISIPQWCDCCQLPAFRRRRSAVISIPQWCDCCHAVKKQSVINAINFNPTMVRLLPGDTNSKHWA